MLGMSDLNAIEAILSNQSEDLYKKIDAAKLSVLRGMHSGDKISKILVALVDKAVEVCGPELWRCRDCGHEDIWEVQQAAEGGTPVCPRCDIDMYPIEPEEHLFETEEWKAAEALVLRINQIKASKETKKKAKEKQ